MQVGRTGLIGEILALLGNRHNGLQLLAGGLVLQSKSSRDISFDQLAGPLELRRGRYFSAVLISLRADAMQQVKGLPHLQAAAFVAAANLAWKEHALRGFDTHRPEIIRLAEVVTRLMTPRRYPAARLVQPFLDEVTELLERLPETPPADGLDASLSEKLTLLAKFKRDPIALRQMAIESFVSGQLVTMTDFFDRIETMPLTTEQRRAIVVDEDATLVLASAGSGKTSVITAKAAYLIQQGLRGPDEILLMAFAKDAAGEMSRRIKTRAGYDVAAKTFHALAYGILAQVEGTAPALAAHASDDGQFNTLLREILKAQVAAAGETGRLILRWFAEFSGPIAARGISRPAVTITPMSKSMNCARCEVKKCAALKSWRLQTGYA